MASCAQRDTWAVDEIYQTPGREIKYVHSDGAELDFSSGIERS